MKLAAVIVLLAACATAGEPASPDAAVMTEATPSDDPNRCDAIAGDTCTGERVCVGDVCEAAFPRIYAVSSIRVRVPMTNGSANWDVGGGAPDLYVQVLVNDQVVGTTIEVGDDFDVTLGDRFELTLVAGSTVKLVAYDRDIDADDLAFECVFAPITPDVLRTHQGSCTRGTSFLIEFDIWPRSE